MSLTDPFGLCPDSNSAFKNFCIGISHLDWNAIGHAALDTAGIFFEAADVINAIWYACEKNTEMAIACAISALPGVGLAAGNLLMKGDKFAAAGKVVKAIAKLTQGTMGLCSGIQMAKTGFTNFLNGLEAGTFDAKSFFQTLGGIGIALLSGKNMVSSGGELLACTGNSGKTMKGTLIDADISGKPVENIGGATFEGTIYRNVDNKYNPLEMSQYTINANYRYTGKGMPGLYFGSGEKIVRAEVGNYNVTDFSNRTTYSYDVRLTNMLDVSNPSVREQLGVSLDSIVGDSYGYVHTHSVGRFAYQNGYNGIIAPSARADGGVNLILFDGKGVK